MGTNLAAPSGLVFSRNLIAASPTFQWEMRLIKNGYASNIGIGDLVITQSAAGANQGYVAISTGVEIAQLGVFAGITSPPPSGSAGQAGAVGDGVYDTNAGTIVYGRNGAYVSTIAPPAGTDIGAKVISDPFAIFRVQMIGGAFTASLVGQNINFSAGTNGAPNAAGQSVLSVDFATVGADPTLPFKIVGAVGIAGGPQDPSNTNPWLEVRLNTAEMLQALGI